LTINSMTGFARNSGGLGDWSWQWEAKSVNGKALDVRMRLPVGYEHLESELRQRIQKILKRGNIQLGLTVNNNNASEAVNVNRAVLKELTAVVEVLRKEINSPPVQAENLLALPGVLELQRSEISEAESLKRDAALLASFDVMLADLKKARAEEGRRLLLILSDQIERIGLLASAARDNPARKPEAIRQRLKEQVARLLDTGVAFDEARLHQEAVLVATRSDIQEELDRLDSHIEAAADLLKSTDPVGRKFDFLAQEFNREASTLCSKAIDRSLTAIGLDLKTLIDQMREQVQNIE